MRSLQHGRHEFVQLTVAAERDLLEIWTFSEERWGSDQAEAYLNEIRSMIERVAEDPDRGRTADDIRVGYRRYPAGSHAIFYVLAPKGIVVVRILHQRMGPSRHL